MTKSCCKNFRLLDILSSGYLLEDFIYRQIVWQVTVFLSVDHLSCYTTLTLVL